MVTDIKIRRSNTKHLFGALIVNLLMVCVAPIDAILVRNDGRQYDVPHSAQSLIGIVSTCSHNFSIPSISEHHTNECVGTLMTADQLAKKVFVVIHTRCVMRILTSIIGSQDCTPSNSFRRSHQLCFYSGPTNVYTRKIFIKSNIEKLVHSSESSNVLKVEIYLPRDSAIFGSIKEFLYTESVNASPKDAKSEALEASLYGFNHITQISSAQTDTIPHVCIPSTQVSKNQIASQALKLAKNVGNRLARGAARQWLKTFDKREKRATHLVTEENTFDRKLTYFQRNGQLRKFLRRLPGSEELDEQRLMTPVDTIKVDENNIIFNIMSRRQPEKLGPPYIVDPIDYGTPLITGSHVLGFLTDHKVVTNDYDGENKLRLTFSRSITDTRI